MGVSALEEIVAYSCRERGERTIYDSTVTVRLPVGPVGEVRSRFDDGSVTLLLPEELRRASGRRQSSLCQRRQASSNIELAFVGVDATRALQAQGSERLGEFRHR